MIELYVMNIAGRNLIKMFGLQGPTIDSIEAAMTSEDNDKVFINQERVSLPLLGLWSGGDKPFTPVDLDKESRRFIHVRAKNVIKSYNKDGKLSKTDKYYDVAPCSSKSFKTEYE